MKKMKVFKNEKTGLYGWKDEKGRILTE
jgi:hypothetical protein